MTKEKDSSFNRQIGESPQQGLLRLYEKHAFFKNMIYNRNN